MSLPIVHSPVSLDAIDRAELHAGANGTHASGEAEVRETGFEVIPQPDSDGTQPMSTPRNLQCRLISSIQELDSIRSVWEELQWHPNADIDFFSTIIEARDEVLRPHVLLVEDNGKGIAIIAGRLERVDFDLKIGYKSLGRWKINQITIVYGGLMGDCSESVAKLVVKNLYDTLRSASADLVSFAFVRANHPIQQAVRNVPLFCRDFGIRPIEHFNVQMDTFDEIFSRMSSKRRSELRRLPKVLEKQYPAKIERYTSAEDVSGLCDDADAVMTGTYQRGLGAGFIKNAENIQRLQLSARKKWMLAYFLYVAGRPCAFWIGALYRDNFFLEFTGYDPAFGKYEPGTILLDHMIKDVSSSFPNIRNLDYGFGQALYKQRFSNDRWQEMSLRMTAPSIKGCCLNLINTINGITHKLAISILQNAGLVQKLKSAWRQRLRA